MEMQVSISVTKSIAADRRCASERLRHQSSNMTTLVWCASAAGAQHVINNSKTRQDRLLASTLLGLAPGRVKQI